MIELRIKKKGQEITELFEALEEVYAWIDINKPKHYEIWKDMGVEFNGVEPQEFTETRWEFIDGK